MTIDIGKDDQVLNQLQSWKDRICNKIATTFSTTNPVTIPFDLFRFVQGGKPVLGTDLLRLDETLHVELRGSLKGGKGGFGSLLRSVKPKAQQDDNFEACRDLSGRRLRHINNE